MDRYRSQPQPLPYHRNFRLRLPAEQGVLVVATTQQMVSIYRVMTPHAQPDYTIHWLASECPALAALHHDLWGWDLVGLIGFIWREIDMLRTFDLRDPVFRAEAGLSTVSAPSRTQKLQEKRPAGQTMQLIQDYVVDHPGCTRLEISRGVDRKKTPHLIAQIECLVLLEILARTHIIRPGGVVEYRYVFMGAAPH